MTIKFKDIKNNINTGDLILFAGEELDSKIIRRFIKTKWCHVGVVIKIPDWDILMLWEYSPTATLSDSLHGRKKRGMQIVPLERRLEEYKGTFSIRHLMGINIEDNPLMKKTFVAYKKEIEHRCLETGIISSWKFRIHFIIDAFISIFLRRKPKKEAINCAHMVAELYQRIGLLHKPPKGLPSWAFTPKNFVEDQGLELRYGYLSEQIEFEL